MLATVEEEALLVLQVLHVLHPAAALERGHALQQPFLQVGHHELIAISHEELTFEKDELAAFRDEASRQMAQETAAQQRGHLKKALQLD